jgi:glycosyltransferase involved in cell wall biosynthesis
MSARFALAVPYYAGLAYLAEALASAQAQEDGDWSLVVFDDSADKEPARALVEGLGDARIRYRANPGTLGMVACWNRALEESEGELLTLFHADDLLLPGYVAECKRLHALHPEAVACFTAARTIDERGDERFSLQDDIKRWLVPRGGAEVVLRGEAGLRALMRGNFIVCPSLCFQRARLGGRRFDGGWKQVQDLELLTRLLFEDETLVGSRRAVYAYRRHGQNATARATESWLRFEEEFALFDAVARAARARGWPRAAGVSRRKTMLRLHLGWRALVELLRLRPRVALEALAFLLRR